MMRPLGAMFQILVNDTLERLYTDARAEPRTKLPPFRLTRKSTTRWSLGIIYARRSTSRNYQAVRAKNRPAIF